MEKNNLIEMYGTKVFNDKVMRARLPMDIYYTMKKIIYEGKQLDKDTAKAVAKAMKDWAVENGATHYTHWFQPLTGITAEKHDSFLSPAQDGSAVLEFSVNTLIKERQNLSLFLFSSEYLEDSII